MLLSRNFPESLFHITLNFRQLFFNPILEFLNLGTVDFDGTEAANGFLYLIEFRLKLLGVEFFTDVSV